MTSAKARLRREAAVRRSQLSPEQRAQAEQALAQAVPPLVTGRVAAYASVGTEPGAAALLAALLAARADVLLPVLLPDDDLDWARYDGTLVPSRRGLLEPPGPRLGREVVAECGVVVVPALAVDRSGARLGRGGGSYDRALARTSALVVAALHTGELLDRLPVEPHDRPVHAAVLPGPGLVRLRAYDRTGESHDAGL